jgi:hypothetical protein
MDKECAVYDGYCFYRISGTRRARFIIDYGEGFETGTIIIPMFKIANGIVRSSNWNGDTSKDSEIEDQYRSNSDYECLLSNIEASKDQFFNPKYKFIPAPNHWVNDTMIEIGPDEPKLEIPIRTTIVVAGDDGHFGVAIVPGMVIARIKEEVISNDIDECFTSYDGYCVYHISSYHKEGVRFLADCEDAKGKYEQRYIVPLFRIANGQVRTRNWNGDTSGEELGNDYDCLHANIKATEDINPIKGKTIVITTDDGLYGVGVFKCIPTARIKEEVIPLHC